jgi:UDP-N-acetylmuramate dehydrogenase
VAGCLVEASVIEADGSEAVLPASGLGLAYRQSALKAAPPDAPRIVTWGRFRLVPAEPAVITERLDAIRRWRQAHQPLGQPSAGSVFRNPADGSSAGALIDGLGLKGNGGRRRRVGHANFIVNDRADAADVRHPSRCGPGPRETGLELRFEVVFAGDWSGGESVA